MVVFSAYSKSPECYSVPINYNAQYDSDDTQADRATQK